MRWLRMGCAAAAVLAAGSLVVGCDRSRQSADGSVAAGSTGTATAQTSGTVADTGSPEQGGANGTPSNTTVVNGMAVQPGQAPVEETRPAPTPHAKGP